MAIGVEKIPDYIRNSQLLSQEELVQLGSHSEIPAENEVELFAGEPEVSAILEYFTDNPEGRAEELHKLAKTYLADGDADKAWKTLLQV